MIMAHATSPTPSLAASILECPSDMRRLMFSTTTILLSTNIPPIKLRIENDNNMVSGIATPTKSALRKPSQNMITNTTSTIPKKILFSRSLTCIRVKPVWSLVIVSVRLEGRKSLFASSIAILMASLASRRFSPPRLITSRLTTGFLNSRAYDSFSFSANVTVATSRR